MPALPFLIMILMGLAVAVTIWVGVQVRQLWLHEASIEAMAALGKTTSALEKLEIRMEAAVRDTDNLNEQIKVLETLLELGHAQ